MLDWPSFFGIARKTVFRYFYKLPGWNPRGSRGAFVLPVHRCCPRYPHWEFKEDVDARRAALEKYAF